MTEELNEIEAAATTSLLDEERSLHYVENDIMYLISSASPNGVRREIHMEEEEEE